MGFSNFFLPQHVLRTLQRLFLMREANDWFQLIRKRVKKKTTLYIKQFQHRVSNSFLWKPLTSCKLQTVLMFLNLRTTQSCRFQHGGWFIYHINPPLPESELLRKSDRRQWHQKLVRRTTEHLSPPTPAPAPAPAAPLSGVTRHVHLFRLPTTRLCRAS